MRKRTTKEIPNEENSLQSKHHFLVFTASFLPYFYYLPEKYSLLNKLLLPELPLVFAALLLLLLLAQRLSFALLADE